MNFPRKGQRTLNSILASCIIATACHAASPIAHAQAEKSEGSELKFKDVTEEVGIASHLKNWTVAHSGSWGDINGDGRPELYLGAFADRPIYKKEGSPIPNPLFINKASGFTLSPDETVRLDGVNARTTYSMMVDFDNDGDLDIAAITHADKLTKHQSQLFENDGKGNFTNHTPTSKGWPRPLAARNVAPIDFDGDGMLDLLVSDGSYRGVYGGVGRVYALRQTKPWVYDDITEELGLPMTGASANGLAVGDVNNDGKLDFFLAQSNRMFVSNGDTFSEVTKPTFVGPRTSNNEAMTCGAAFGDLDNNGLLDLITTVHGQPGQIDVYLNQGLRDGMPMYEHVTEQLGLAGFYPKMSSEDLPIKVAHVAIQDFDNDGLCDIMLSILYRDEDGNPQPVVLRNLGMSANGLPEFTKPQLDKLIVYFAQAPVADYDRDGRLDIFFPSWFPEVPSSLMRNVTDTGNYLEVTVTGAADDLNRQGIGATVRAYEAGHAGSESHLLGRRDITIGNGYSSGELAVAHFGLGSKESCDIVVMWQGRAITKSAVKAGQSVNVRFEE